ncbi:MAG: organomercurial lyase [Dehalococcoidia bacterium]
MNRYADIPLPTALAERLQAAQGLPRPPATLGEYVAAPEHRFFVDPSGLYCDSAQSCCGEHSRHEVTIAGATRNTHCVLDTLLLAIIEKAEAASVRSVSPLSGEVVMLEIGSHGVVAGPPAAVITFGLLREGGGTVYETLCPYVNAFSSEEDYQRWAEATPEAVTVSMSVRQAWEFACDMLGAAPDDA